MPTSQSTSSFARIPLAIVLALTMVLSPVSALAQKSKPIHSTSKHRHHAKHPAHKPKHKHKKKAPPKALPAALCDDNSKPVSEGGSFSCADGSEPACADGATPVVHGSSLLCPANTDASGEQACEEEADGCPAGSEAGEEEAPCEACEPASEEG